MEYIHNKYKEEQFIYDLKGNTFDLLSNTANYRDAINVGPAGMSLVKRTLRITLTPSYNFGENTSTPSEGMARYFTDITHLGVKPFVGSKCNYFKYGEIGSTAQIFSLTTDTSVTPPRTYLNFIVKKTDFPTPSDFKTSITNVYNAGKPLYCILSLATPQNVLLTPNGASSAHSLHPNFNMECEPPCTLQMQYAIR